MTVTGEGLRIELLENQKGMFFENGQAKPTENAHVLLMELASELGKMPNTVLIEGHTDSKAFSEDNGYSNWELSTDRANAARKLMEENGLKENQVVEIRGYADQELRLKDKPEDPSNRRISIIVRYTDAPSAPEPKGGAAKEGEGGEGEGKGGEGEGKGEGKGEEGAEKGAEHGKPAEGTKPPVPAAKGGH